MAIMATLCIWFIITGFNFCSFSDRNIKGLRLKPKQVHVLFLHNIRFFMHHKNLYDT